MAIFLINDSQNKKIDYDKLNYGCQLLDISRMLNMMVIVSNFCHE